MTPTIKHIKGQWCAVFEDLKGGSPKVLFRSLKRANVVDFIKYSWNGVNLYSEGN